MHGAVIFFVSKPQPKPGETPKPSAPSDSEQPPRGET
jgi:hypothetical protein